LEHSGIDANAYGRISLFDALKSGPASEGAFGHDPGRETAASSCIAQVVP